jgi:hypothetical protein
MAIKVVKQLAQTIIALVSQIQQPQLRVGTDSHKKVHLVRQFL